MKKKMLSFTMALIVCCTFLQCLTLNKSVNAAGVNITPYGSFDTERELLANTKKDWSTTEWVNDGNSGGYAKTSAIRWWENTIFASVPLVPGETYTISADIMSADTDDTISIIDRTVSGNSYTGRTVTVPTDLTITTSWKTFTFTYTNTCTLADGTVVANDYLNIGFRRGPGDTGQGKYFYIDNLMVTPSGSTGYDFSGYINGMWGDMESFDTYDGFVPEQPEGDMPYMEVYVDGDNGDDANAGTEKAPLKTIEAAKEKIQPSLADMTGHIYVYLKGNINLTETIYWGTEDSGQNGYNVIYTAWGEASPEITMKKDYSDFSLYDEEKNIYRTYVGTDVNSRQVYINGIRGQRARTDDLTKSSSLLTNASRVPTDNRLYYVSSDTYLADLTRQTEVEFVYTNQWTNPRVLVDKIYKIGTDRVRIDINKDSWAQNMALSNTNVIGNYPSWIENAYELLDSPGEWYINHEDGYLYYMPREYETANTMIATIPYGEQAFVIEGTSTEEKVHNLVFRGLCFKYTTWYHPNEAGIRDEQAMFFDSYKGNGRTTGGTADAAVTVLDAAYVDITDCSFSQLGGHGIFYTEVFQKCEVTGNHVYDVSASGIVMGHNTRQGNDYLKYYRPTKYKNYLIENKINNNLVHDIGVDYMSAPGITVSMLINSEVNHNEIYNTNYSGLHVGWGWNSYDYGRVTSNCGNKIMYNYIHDTMQTHLYDGGCIYVLGHTGGKNEIAYNYLENHRNGHGAIYFDEGSDRWHAYKNVIDLKEIDMWPINTVPYWMSGGPFIGANTENGKVYENYSTTSALKGTMTVPEGAYEAPAVYETANWPAEAQAIVDAAGLESKYISKYPDSIQRLRILNEKENEYFLEDGETMQLNLTAYSRKLKENSLSNVEVVYYSSNKNVATVSESGLITAVGRGKCAIYAEYKDNDVIRRKHVNVVTHAPVKEIVSDLTNIALLVGKTQDITATGKTTWGGTEKIVPTVTFDQSGIATVSDGIITAVNEGKTVMHATYSADGKTLEKDITVYVSKHNKGSETLAHKDQSVKPANGNSFFKKNNWTGKLTELWGRLTVSGTTPNFMPAYYKTETELISFDVKMNNPMSWPSFVVGAEDINKNYKDNCYLITLKNDRVELYRFNKGERTVIFGSEEYTRQGGDAFTHNSLYRYGTKFSVTIGTKNTESGTNIVLIINGVPVFDYVDTEAARVSGKYFGIYEWNGDFTLSPFTNITK